MVSFLILKLYLFHTLFLQTSYVNRAEEIKKLLDSRNNRKVATVGGGGAGADEKEGDSEAKKLQDSLSSAIVRIAPNIKWDDVAGLDTVRTLIPTDPPNNWHLS